MYSQISYRGEIVDLNQKPIPFASVRIAGSNIATTANINGKYNLQLDSVNAVVIAQVSCIGYHTNTLALTKSYQTITLSEDIKELNPVTILPYDYATELMQRVIKNIPLNYSNKREHYEGFFRETTSWGSGNPFNPIYIAEAVIELIKEPYTQKTSKGIVKLIEGRLYKTSTFDSLPVRIYSGPHSAFYYDIIAKRDLFLASLKNYHFEIIDTTRYNSKNVFKLSFSSSNSRCGFIYVVDSTYALLRLELYAKKNSLLLPENIGRQYRSLVVDYEEGYDHKWRLKYFQYRSSWIRRNRHFTMEREYTTTNLREDLSDIPYDEQIKYSDFFIEKTGNYNPNFWDGYTTFISNDSIDSYFKQKDNFSDSQGRSNKRKSFLSMLPKLSLIYQLSYTLLRRIPLK